MESMVDTRTKTPWKKLSNKNISCFFCVTFSNNKNETSTILKRSSMQMASNSSLYFYSLKGCVLFSPQKWGLKRDVIFLAATITIFLLILFFNSEYDKSSLQILINGSRPVIVWYTDNDAHGVTNKLLPEDQTLNCSSQNKVIQCDITTASRHHGPAAGYFFFGTLIQHLPLPRDPKTVWGLFYEESPILKPELWNEEILNLFNVSCTLSRHSDVPMPLVYMNSFSVVTSKAWFVSTSNKNQLLSEIAPILYLQSNCNTSTERDAYVGKLMQYIPVDSYGKCLNNKKFPERMSHLAPAKNQSNYLYLLSTPELYAFMTRYKFVIAIENAVCNDYVTEKFWRAIYLGVVPIYFGSPLIRDWMPNKKSAILLEDYPTPKLLSEHLNDLLQNDTKYEEYLEHKTKDLITNRRLFEEMEKRPDQNNYVMNINKLHCVMCERIHEFSLNSSRISIVTKKQYDCPTPISALTLSVNQNNPYIQVFKDKLLILQK